jgi:peptidoglycan/LPS O-acetylase OafA/YrhL
MLLQTPPVSESVYQQPTTTPRIRLDFLDGLRGLAAFYVVLHHAFAEVNPDFNGKGLRPSLLFLTNWLLYGHAAVAVFIVLSGYCLMLPVATSADSKLRGGTWSYLKRRARRILPPYYAALVLSLMLTALISLRPHPFDPRWPASWADFHADALLSHLFLVHNLWNWLAFRIDPPMWSVATEWQIYFLFPLLLLLPLQRRYGLFAPVLVGFVLGYIPHFGFHGALDAACFWYIGLFALGMAGASIGFSERPRECRLRERLPWGALCLAFTAVAVVKLYLKWTNNWISDPLLGLAAVCLIVYCARLRTQGETLRRPLVLRLLESRGAVELGTFSYSLYLVHFPILSLFHIALLSRSVETNLRLILLLSVAVPLAVGASYLFHLAFERRFMPGSPKTERAVVQAAVRSPAP